MSKKINRRDFLKVSAASAASMGVFGLSFPKSAFAATSNAPILIQCELIGGCDNANFSGFRNGSLYNAFLAKRTSSACNPASQIVPIDAAGTDPIGLHPSFGAPLLAAGHLSSVRLLLNQSNDPGFNDGSHQVMQKVMALGTSGSYPGSTGTFARLYEAGVPLIGFDGKGEDYACTHCSSPPLKMNTLEGFNLSGISLGYQYGGQANTDQAINVVNDLVSSTPNRTISPLEKKYRSAMASMFGAFGQAAEMLNYPTPKYSSYTKTSIAGYDGLQMYEYNLLATRFRNIAEIINYRKAKNLNEPMLFNIGVGGFDAHSDWHSINNKLMYNLGNILSVFFSDLKALGVWNRVVFYTISEFGRRIYANGSGTDHGNGFTSLIAGGKIKRGIFGDPLTASQISTLDNWPAQYDFRAVIAQLVSGHLGLNPQTTAYPNGLYDAIRGKDTNFDLFV